MTSYFYNDAKTWLEQNETMYRETIDNYLNTCKSSTCINAEHMLENLGLLSEHYRKLLRERYGKNVDRKLNKLSKNFEKQFSI